MRTRIFLRGSIVGLLLAVVSCGGSRSTGAQGGCEVSLDNTILFDPPLTAPGDYQFDVELAGQTGQCSATLTVDGSEGVSCSPNLWYVLQSDTGEAQGGKIVPIAPNDVLGLLVGEAAASEAFVKVTKDAVTVVEGAFSLETRTVSDPSCGEVSRREATVDVP